MTLFLVRIAASGSGLWHKAPQAQIIDHLLDLLDLVLDTITSPPQAIVFQVQNLEAGVQLIHKLADLEWSCEVTESDTVRCEAAELFDQRDEGLKVLLDGDVVGVFELEVDWDCAAR